jgi:FixJ family two-component response regulator
MPPEDLTVHVVDDDPAVRDALATMLGIAGYRTATFADAEAFLAAVTEDTRGCLVADLKLPGASGLELQATLRERGIGMPVIIITAHGDLDTARTAFHAEAVDFLPKPCESAQLLASIDTALEREQRRLSGEAQRRGFDARYGSLTQREREILGKVAEGLHAKEIAALFGISPRTVEVHKSRIMDKVGARNVAELVRFAMGGAPPEPRGAGEEPAPPGEK